jgi:hypothetical protein
MSAVSTSSGESRERGVVGRLVNPQPDFALIDGALETQRGDSTAGGSRLDGGGHVEAARRFVGDETADTPDQRFLLPRVEQLRAGEICRRQEDPWRALARRCGRRLGQPATAPEGQPDAAGSGCRQYPKRERQAAGPY